MNSSFDKDGDVIMDDDALALPTSTPSADQPKRTSLPSAAAQSSTSQQTSSSSGGCGRAVRYSAPAISPLGVSTAAAQRAASPKRSSAELPRHQRPSEASSSSSGSLIPFAASPPRTPPTAIATSLASVQSPPLASPQSPSASVEPSTATLQSLAASVQSWTTSIGIQPTVTTPLNPGDLDVMAHHVESSLQAARTAHEHAQRAADSLRQTRASASPTSPLAPLSAHPPASSGRPKRSLPAPTPSSLRSASESASSFPAAPQSSLPIHSSYQASLNSAMGLPSSESNHSTDSTRYRVLTEEQIRAIDAYLLALHEPTPTEVQRARNVADAYEGATESVIHFRLSALNPQYDRHAALVLMWYYRKWYVSFGPQHQLSHVQRLVGIQSIFSRADADAASAPVVLRWDTSASSASSSSSSGSGFNARPFQPGPVLGLSLRSDSSFHSSVNDFFERERRIREEMERRHREAINDPWVPIDASGNSRVSEPLSRNSTTGSNLGSLSNNSFGPSRPGTATQAFNCGALSRNSSNSASIGRVRSGSSSSSAFARPGERKSNSFGTESASSVPSPWACSACTYENADGVFMCEMCETPRFLATAPSYVRRRQQRAMRGEASLGARIDSLLRRNREREASAYPASPSRFPASSRFPAASASAASPSIFSASQRANIRRSPGSDDSDGSDDSIRIIDGPPSLFTAAAAAADAAGGVHRGVFDRLMQQLWQEQPLRVASFGRWACPSCTYENLYMTSTCHICLARRVPGGSSSVPSRDRTYDDKIVVEESKEEEASSSSSSSTSSSKKSPEPGSENDFDKFDLVKAAAKMFERANALLTKTPAEEEERAKCTRQVRTHFQKFRNAVELSSMAQVSIPKKALDDKDYQACLDAVVTKLKRLSTKQLRSCSFSVKGDRGIGKGVHKTLAFTLFNQVLQNCWGNTMRVPNHHADHLPWEYYGVITGIHCVAGGTCTGMAPDLFDMSMFHGAPGVSLDRLVELMAMHAEGPLQEAFFAISRAPNPDALKQALNTNNSKGQPHRISLTNHYYGYMEGDLDLNVKNGFMLLHAFMRQEYSEDTSVLWRKFLTGFDRVTDMSTFVLKHGLLSAKRALFTATIPTAEKVISRMYTRRSLSIFGQQGSSSPEDDKLKGWLGRYLRENPGLVQVFYYLVTADVYWPASEHDQRITVMRERPVRRFPIKAATCFRQLSVSTSITSYKELAIAMERFLRSNIFLGGNAFGYL